MASETEISNLAISHCGSGKEISNLDTDSSEEGSVCRRFYELARDQVLRDFAWTFATKFRAVALIEEDPNDEWDYSYRYPSDCLKIRRILSGQRRDTNDTRVPYKVAADDSGLLFYCDTEDAEIEYTMRQDDPSFYPADFIMALSYKLAFYIAPRITAGDPFNLQQKFAQLYQMEIDKAAKNSVNEEQPDVEAESELQRSRV